MKRPTPRPTDSILVEAFGNVFIRLLKEGKITQTQFVLLLDETKKEITKELAKELDRFSAEADEYIKEMFKSEKAPAN